MRDLGLGLRRRRAKRWPDLLRHVQTLTQGSTSSTLGYDPEHNRGAQGESLARETRLEAICRPVAEAVQGSGWPFLIPFL